MDDLRDWLMKVDGIGELKSIEGADWNLEIGAITALNTLKKMVLPSFSTRLRTIPAATELSPVPPTIVAG